MGESIHSSPAPEERPAEQRAGQTPFNAQVELLQLFLARRDEIVERIQGLLNAQRKPAQYLEDVPLLSRHFEDCFFTLTGITGDQSRLRDQLEEAHWASGFRPRKRTGLPNDLVRPADMMARGFHLWRRTHWPGHSGRLRYAHTLFNLYVIRRLALLTMRVWDEGSDGAAGRLSKIQGVLDHLWKLTPDDQPVLVRDVRWLIPVAMSPITDELAGYFEVAEQVRETLSEDVRGGIHKAVVLLVSGHLRTQLRHVSMQQGVTIGENSLVLSARRSNTLDLALLIQGLVPLLGAYEDACGHALQGGSEGKRLELADTICQAISPDPELFLNRLDLLCPYSMIEHCFITQDRDGNAAYTPMGRRHVRLLREYETRIRRVSKPLYDDCRHFRPVDGAYSPYGVLYGFASTLIELMAFRTLQRDAVTRFSLEDVFTSGDAGKLAWVSGWRKLPHVRPDVVKPFEYPRQFVEDVFARIEHALRRCASDGEANGAARTGHLFLVPGDNPEADSKLSHVADLPVRYVLSSDWQIVAAHKARSLDQRPLLHSRLEGEFLVSYETSNGWVAVTKDILTEGLGAGSDVRIVGLPPSAAGVLSLMCPDLVVLADS